MRKLDGMLESIQKLEIHTEKIEKVVIQSEKDDLKNNKIKIIEPIDEKRGNQNE